MPPIAQMHLALILAHRTALDLLDKIAVAANHYFEFGTPPDKVYFCKLWRGSPDKATGVRPLDEKGGAGDSWDASALYGLVELADDYDSSAGILRSQKDLRNAGTYRFVVLHDLGDPAQSRQAGVAPFRWTGWRLNFKRRDRTPKQGYPRGRRQPLSGWRRVAQWVTRVGSTTLE